MIKNQKGMTLIEMVITVAIIGIIAAVAWPEYERHKTKNRRTDGINALMEAAQELQQCHTDEGGYIKTDGSTECTYRTNSDEGHFTIDDNNTITVDSYTLTATPTRADGECSTLTLTNLGVKGFTTTNSSPDPVGTLNRCWSQ